MNKDQILQKLRESLIKSKEEEIDTKGFEQSIKNTDNPNNAAELVKKIDKLIKCNKNNILRLAYQQRMVFKEFKKIYKFVNALIEFEISKTTMNFEIDIVNFIDKYPKMQKSSISHFYLKNNFRIIKNVCHKNMLPNFNSIFLANILYYSKVNPF